MPFDLSRLDTRPPPKWLDTWGGDVRVADLEDYEDDDTAIRPSTGDDMYNYRVDQRYQGDLWWRDMVLSTNLASLRNYLQTRTGLCYNCPSVRLMPGDALDFASITLPTLTSPATPTPNWAVVALQLQNLTDSDAVLRLAVINSSNAEVVFSSTLGTTFKAADVTSLGPLLSPGSYKLRLSNTGSSRKAASAAVILQPRLIS